MPKLRSDTPEHLRRYPVRDMDLTTLRHLHDDSEKWLIDTQKIRCAVKAEAKDGGLEAWDELITADIQEEAEALAIVDAEIQRKRPHLGAGVIYLQRPGRPDHLLGPMTLTDINLKVDRITTSVPAGPGIQATVERDGFVDAVAASMEPKA